MKTVGIIGGLGPQTTAEFYLEVTFGCHAKSGVSRPPMLIWNVPLKYEIENDLLVKSTGEERYLPCLLEGARRLEASGADFIVMPCNTLHVFIDEIRDEVDVPVLSIVEETAKFLKRKKIAKVGLLATSVSLKHKLYEKELEKCGIGQVLPDGLDQAKIGRMVNNLVLGRHSNLNREELLGIIGKFEKEGVEDAILACTDLQLLIPSHHGLRIEDTMKIFAEATVREILGVQCLAER